VRAPAGSTRLVRKYRRADLGSSPDQAFLHLSIGTGGEPADNELFLAEPKRCAVARAKVTCSVTETKNGLAVRLSTDRPAFYVALSAAGIAGEFDDNCFTLLPGSPRVLRFTPSAPGGASRPVTASELGGALSVMHLRDTYR
jgi:beta-mannosidase